MSQTVTEGATESEWAVKFGESQGSRDMETAGCQSSRTRGESKVSAGKYKSNLKTVEQASTMAAVMTWQRVGG